MICRIGATDADSSKANPLGGETGMPGSGTTPKHVQIPEQTGDRCCNSILSSRHKIQPSASESTVYLHVQSRGPQSSFPRPSLSGRQAASARLQDSVLDEIKSFEAKTQVDKSDFRLNYRDGLCMSQGRSSTKSPQDEGSHDVHGGHRL